MGQRLRLKANTVIPDSWHLVCSLFFFLFLSFFQQKTHCSHHCIAFFLFGDQQHSKAVAYALKKYGCIIADNGIFFFFSLFVD
jgi:hypothetical protein